MDELDAKEKADQKKRHDRNVANRETLDEQVSILNGKKKELKDRNLAYERSELARWSAEDEAEKKKQQGLLEAAYARGKATKEFNVSNMGKDKVRKVRVRVRVTMLPTFIGVHGQLSLTPHAPTLQRPRRGSRTCSCCSTPWRRRSPRSRASRARKRRRSASPSSTVLSSRTR